MLLLRVGVIAIHAARSMSLSTRLARCDVSADTRVTNEAGTRLTSAAIRHPPPPSTMTQSGAGAARRTMSKPPCPYAVAVHEGSDTDEEVDYRKACPAFEDGACPFRDSQSPEALRARLLQMPASHTSTSHPFTHALKDMHQFNLEGLECPVPANIRQNFFQHMESFSLASVMAKLAEAHHEDISESSDHDASDTADKVVLETLNAPNSTDTPTQESRRKSSLSQSLKTGTAVAHQAAEDVHFVSNFIRGKIDRQLYADLVVMLYYVYKQLEESLDEHAAKHFASCHFPRELARLETLEEDLDFWVGGEPPSMSPATRDYVDRIAKVAREQPLLLLAHSYTRYLGDLSGGRILLRVARKAMDLGEDGLAFYQFANVESAKKFKDEYRQALDDLPLTDEQVHAIVKEANVAFLLNVRLFEELDVKANVPGSVVRPLTEVLQFADVSVHQNADAPEECPFLNKNKSPTVQEAHVTGARCPWPFVVAHDPKQFLLDWQTWALTALLAAWLWSRVVAASTS